MAAARDPRSKALKLIALATSNENAHERDAALLALGKLVASRPELLLEAPPPRAARKSDFMGKVRDAAVTASADPRVKKAAADVAAAAWEAFIRR
jgi:hypothetical protein